MNLGAEPKKVAFLCFLVAVGGYTVYTNLLSSPREASAVRRDATPPAAISRAAAPAPRPDAPSPSIRRAGSRVSQGDEFRPSLKLKPEDKPDMMTIDPALRLDLLARLQEVRVDGGARNIFQFSTPPPPPMPKGPEPKIKPVIPAETAAAPPPPAGPPPPPPPPPIPLKYYGFSTSKVDGRKTAFFLDGEDILVGAEGDTVKKRYKIVRIGVNSVVVEDTVSKSQQPLPLQEELPT
jgi:hypothetical protein